MQKPLVGLAVAVLALCCAVPSSATSIVIAGNSTRGTGDGSGTWNVTSDLGGTTSLSYNGGSAAVFGLGNGVSIQLACDNNTGPCAVGSGSQIDYLFQIPTSQISGGTVTFNNFTFGSLTGVTSFFCNQGGGNGPGFLCSTLPNNGSGISINAALNGTTLTFSISGSLSGVTSLTFVLPYSNTNSTLSGPTLAGSTAVPEPASVFLVGSGLAALISRRKRKA